MLGTYTASFFRLDPTGSVPVEPIADVLPGVTPFRVTLDAITNEELARTWRVTQHAIQDLVDVTPHRQRNLEQLSITGVLSSAPMPSLLGIPPGPTLGARFDLLRLSFLIRMAKRGEPIMVVTPRQSLALAWVTSLRTPWSPGDGRSTPVAITCQEARIASPQIVAGVKDLDQLESGNTEASSGGEQAGQQVDAAVTEPPVSQAAPTFGTAGVAIPGAA